MRKPMIDCPLIINGQPSMKRPKRGRSPFYADYHYHLAEASLLDVAAAIGSARQAGRAPLAQRLACLQAAAQAFNYDDADLEHIVRLSGMPITQVAALLAEIPTWMQAVATGLAQRFPLPFPEPIEALTTGQYRLLKPLDGFVYVAAPGNDPRAVALAVANLAALGLPFVVKASPKDALAPKVIQALLDGGFDPHACNLLYFDSTAPEAGEKHARLVTACSAVWTYGPDVSVDAALRYADTESQAAVDMETNDDLDPTHLAAQPAGGKFRRWAARRDLFAGKTVIRHNTGNCAAIVSGPLDAAARRWLADTLAYPLGCTTTRSLFPVAAPGWAVEIDDFLSSLRIGDPLDPQTEVGYVSARTLDELERRVQRSRLQAHFSGGERLSLIQARPLLVTSHTDLPDFFAHEIPAYVLALRACDSTQQAIQAINATTEREPRLAVALYGLNAEQQSTAIQQLHACTILVDRPTTQVSPWLHEGNDYLNLLTSSQLLVNPSTIPA